MNNTDYKTAVSDLAAARAALDAGRYADAFALLRKTAATLSPALAAKADAIEAEYFYMLRFIVSGNDMPDFGATLRALSEKINDLRLAIEAQACAVCGDSVRGGVLRYISMRPEETTESLFSDYLAELDSVNADPAAITDTRRRSKLERISGDIFNRLWAEYPLGSDAAELVASIVTDDAVPFYDRVLWVTALGLSARRSFNSRAVDILVKAHAAADARVSTMATVWLMLIDKSLGDSAADTEARRAVTDSIKGAHPGDFADFTLEFSRLLGTAKLTEQMKNYVGPRLEQLGRKMQQRLSETDPDKIDELLLNGDLGAEIGPEGFDSLKNFVEAQASGADVFMATLGNMRQFTFFNSLGNWFLPFHTAHSMLAPVVDGEGAMVADAIARMPMLCDSDKYALVLSLVNTPESSRASMLTAMTQQFQAMSSMPEAAEALESAQPQSRRALINCHLKNLYRFFNLYRDKGQFSNVFNDSPLFSGYDSVLKDDAVSGEIADELFKNKRYETAAKFYAVADLSLLSNERLRNYAFASEMTGHLHAAVSLYEELLQRDPDDVRASLRMADCVQTDMVEVGEFDADKGACRALEIIRPLSERFPDDTRLLMKLAAIYENLGEWESVVNVYHNIDYLLPEGDKSISEPLARALMVCGDYTSAEHLLESSELSAMQKYGLAIIRWLTARRAEALSLLNSIGPDKVAAVAARFAGLDIIKEREAAMESFALISDMLRYNYRDTRFGRLI